MNVILPWVLWDWIFYNHSNAEVSNTALIQLDQDTYSYATPLLSGLFCFSSPTCRLQLNQGYHYSPKRRGEGVSRSAFIELCQNTQDTDETTRPGKPFNEVCNPAASQG